MGPPLQVPVPAGLIAAPMEIMVEGACWPPFPSAENARVKLSAQPRAQTFRVFARIGASSAIFSSANRICMPSLIRNITSTASNHTPGLSPLPKGKQALSWAVSYGNSTIADPTLGVSDRSPLGAGRVSVVDLGEVWHARKLGLRRWARGGRARGFTGDSEVVQDLAHGFRLDDGGQDLRAPTTLRTGQTGQRVCHEHAFQKKAQGSRLSLGILVRSMSWDSPGPTLPVPAKSAPTASGEGGVGSVAPPWRDPWPQVRGCRDIERGGSAGGESTGPASRSARAACARYLARQAFVQVGFPPPWIVCEGASAQGQVRVRFSDGCATWTGQTDVSL
jgi:hypothetical protein